GRRYNRSAAARPLWRAAQPGTLAGRTMDRAKALELLRRQWHRPIHLPPAFWYSISTQENVSQHSGMNLYRYPSTLHHGVAACDVPGFFNRCSIDDGNAADAVVIKERPCQRVLAR